MEVSKYHSELVLGFGDESLEFLMPTCRDEGLYP